jgi:KaiC/GvpD/RAD55 family RecA-like ATPase
MCDRLALVRFICWFLNLFAQMTVPVPEADSVLVEGSALSGRRRVIHQFLHERGEVPLVVSTRQPAESARRTHRRVVGREPAEADDGANDEPAPLVVDCVTGAVGRSPSHGPHTKYAQHPSNLTSIGTKFTEFLEARDDGALAVGIDTVSPLLMYTDASAVYRFLHIVVQKATGAGCPVVVGLDGSAHDDRVVSQLAPLFDAVVETRRRDDDTREFRVQRPERTEWREIEVV